MTRRLFSLSILPLVAAAPKNIVDTHVHFYDPTRPGGVPWPRPTDTVLYRRVLPSDYRKLSTADVIIVEASPLVQDNDWILELALQNTWIRGVVGNLDPASPDFAGNLERYAANKRFRGIRLGVTKAAQHLDKLGRLEAANLTLDLIGDVAMYPLARQIAERYPKLRIVLDHLPLPEANATIANLREHPNVYAKVSWILRGATDTLDNHRQALDEVLRVFGEDRVLYGSNWPVSDLIAPYPRIEQTAFAYFRDKALEKYTSLNSRSAYRW